MANKTTKRGSHHEPHAPDHAKHHGNDDDLIAVPRGQSRFQFYFTLGLLIFVLLIFTVGGLFQSVIGGVFGGGGASQVALRWVDPETGKETEVGYADFITRKRALDRMAYIGAFLPANARQGAERPKVSDEDTAMWYVLDERAREAGIQVTDEELAARLRRHFGDGPTLRRVAANMRSTPNDLEAELRQVMRTEKYRTFLLSSVAVADVDRVRELWEAEHPEYRFDYVQVAVADFADQAASGVPADEELAEWFRALPEFRKRRFYTEPEYVVDVAWVPLDDDSDAAALLERYPLPEGTDQAAEARSYFNQYTNIRFQTPEETAEEATEGEDAEAEEPEPRKLFYEFEEVEERAAREATLVAALRLWLADLTARAEAGEEVDLAAEATALGLPSEVGAPSRTLSELQEAEGFGGRFVASQLAFGLDPGAFAPRPIVGEDALVVGRLVEQVPASEPPFDQIRERVVDEWKKDRAIELATQSLADLRAGMGAGEDEGVPLVVDAEAFTAAVRDAGLEVVERPYVGRTELAVDDPADATPGDLTIRQTASFFALEEGQVSAPQRNPQGTHVVLVRAAGQRPAPMDAITPADLARLRQQAIFEATQEFESRYMDAQSDWVRKEYALHLASWDEPAGEP